MTDDPDNLVDLLTEKANRRPAAWVFTVTATDIGSSAHIGHFAWEWEGIENEDEWRPSIRQRAERLRLIADRWDPPRVKAKVRRIKSRRRG